MARDRSNRARTLSRSGSDRISWWGMTWLVGPSLWAWELTAHTLRT
jgi:hypothetical protein